MSRTLKKEDAIIVVYDKCYDCIPLFITHSSKHGDWYGKPKDFDEELKSIKIYEQEDEWQYFGDGDEDFLLEMLLERGFNALSSRDRGHEYSNQKAVSDVKSVEDLAETFFNEGMGGIGYYSKEEEFDDKHAQKLWKEFNIKYEELKYYLSDKTQYFKKYENNF